MSDKYNSTISKILAKILKYRLFAITTSKNCTRYSCSKEEVDEIIWWRKHENVHKQQFSKFGWFNFVFQYFLESIKYGYINNKFEVEARKASGEEDVRK